jgi:SNF family Na+-dependent transporter
VNHRPIGSSKLAFTLAAAASAVGLGNLWRFPYLAAKYGGGTFLLTYLLLVFTFGVSMLLIEISLGRRTRQSTIGAFRSYDVEGIGSMIASVSDYDYYSSVESAANPIEYLYDEETVETIE